MQHNLIKLKAHLIQKFMKNLQYFAFFQTKFCLNSSGQILFRDWLSIAPKMRACQRLYCVWVSDLRTVKLIQFPFYRIII